MPSAELQVIIEQVRTRPIAATIEEMRAGLAALEGMFPLAPEVRCEATRADGVPAEWVMAPGAAADRVLLYLHGGGYCSGSIGTHRELVSRLSAASGASGLLIGYRLAPEHPFPAAVEDATGAYRWLLRHGFEPERIAIAGESVGGGLAAATLIAVRDAREPLPAAAVILSPWADLELTGESVVERAERDPVTRSAELRAFAKAYLGGADPRSPLASPIHADLSGLPPLLFQVGTEEILHDDAVRLAERARNAGVEVAFETWQGMIHLWHLFAALLPEGREAISRIGEFVRSRFDRQEIRRVGP